MLERDLFLKEDSLPEVCGAWDYVLPSRIKANKHVISQYDLVLIKLVLF